jgi:hypothetical protein
MKSISDETQGKIRALYHGGHRLETAGKMARAARMACGGVSYVLNH